MCVKHVSFWSSFITNSMVSTETIGTFITFHHVGKACAYKIVPRQIILTIWLLQTPIKTYVHLLMFVWEWDESYNSTSPVKKSHPNSGTIYIYKFWVTYQRLKISPSTTVSTILTTKLKMFFSVKSLAFMWDVTTLVLEHFKTPWCTVIPKVSNVIKCFKALKQCCWKCFKNVVWCHFKQPHMILFK